MRLEVRVKYMKTPLRNNMGPGGTLDTNAFSRVIMEYRNTSDRDTGCSPAKVVFGRLIQDFIPMAKGSYSVRPKWMLT